MTEAATRGRNPFDTSGVHRGSDGIAYYSDRPSSLADAIAEHFIADTIRGWSFTLVFDEVLPVLREAGVLDDDVFKTIFVENPRRWLAGA